MSKAPERDERRAALLDASLQLVAREGIEAATMRRLAAAANCTTGSITHHFANRDELLVEMLRAAHAAAAARMAKAIKQAADPRAQLKAVLREALPLDATRLAEWRIWLAFWSAVPGKEQLAREHEARYVEWRALLGDLCERVAGRGARVEECVEDLMGLVDGYGLQIALTTSLQSKRARALIAAATRAIDRCLAEKVQTA
jgi:TetR/AcrR family transcriptional repressor of bet genes